MTPPPSRSPASSEKTYAPWTLREIDPGVWDVEAHEGNLRICRVAMDEVPEARAVSRLIAAAPSLLSALRELLGIVVPIEEVQGDCTEHDIGELNVALSRARAALALAEGVNP